MVAGLRVFFRSFFIQASFNFERMLNLGFLFAMYPALKVIHKNTAKLKESLRRHIQFFNAHPYMASYALGSLIKLEEEIGKNPRSNANTIRQLREALGTPLGSIGDQFFWALWRPFCGMLGVMLVLLWNPVGAVIVYLIVYNAPHIFIRYWGISISYRKGLDVVKEISKPTFRASNKRANQVAALVLGFFPLVIIFSQMKAGELLVPVTFFVGSALVGYVLMKWKSVSFTILTLMMTTYLIGLL